MMMKMTVMAMMTYHNYHRDRIPQAGHDEKGFLTSGWVRVRFDQKARVSGSGSGIVHIMVLRLILWPFCVIPFYARGQSKQMNVMLFR